jgi:hypothetical protein
MVCHHIWPMGQLVKTFGIFNHYRSLCILLAQDVDHILLDSWKKKKKKKGKQLEKLKKTLFNFQAFLNAS